MAARVLVFGTMGDIGPVVRSSLEAHGLDVVLVDFPQNTCRDEFGYRRGLLKSVALYEPSVIIPVGHQLTMSRIAAELPEWVGTFVECPEKISLLDSKVRCSALAERLDIPQPQIWHSVDEAIASGCSDLIFKRDRSFGGSGVYRPRTEEALRNLSTHEAGGLFLIEEFIPGRDISVDAIRKGEYFAAGSYESVRKKQGQGPSLQRRVIGCPEAVSLVKKLLDAVDYNGVCGADFRMDADGSLYFLECNPRFTGGIRTQIEAGFDIPWLFFNAVPVIQRG